MQRTNRMWSAAVASIVIGGCLVVSAARAAVIYGPLSLPQGINDLSITYSGGTALFNVRFDERSFNDVYGAGSPILPFTTDADISAAMNAVLDVLSPLGLTPVGSTPTYDGTINTFLVYPSIVDSTGVSRYFDIARSPAGWGHAVFESGLSLPLDQSLPDSDQSYIAWVSFTPVPEPSSLALLAVGVTMFGVYVIGGRTTARRLLQR